MVGFIYLVANFDTRGLTVSTCYPSYQKATVYLVTQMSTCISRDERFKTPAYVSFCSTNLNIQTILLVIILCQTQCQRITDAKALAPVGTVQVKILTLSLSSSNHIRTPSLASTAWLARLYPPMGRSLPTGPDTHCCQPAPCHKSSSERQTHSATVLWLIMFVWIHTQKTWDIFSCSDTYTCLTHCTCGRSHTAIPNCYIRLHSLQRKFPCLQPWFFTVPQTQSIGQVYTHPNSNCGQKSCLLHCQGYLNLHVNQQT